MFIKYMTDTTAKGETTGVRRDHFEPVSGKYQETEMIHANKIIRETE